MKIPFLNRARRDNKETPAATQIASTMFHLTRGRKGVYTLLLDMPGPVNTIKRIALEELDRILTALDQDQTCRGLVISTTLAKPGGAGADIKEIYALQQSSDVNVFVNATEGAKRILGRLSNMRFPTVAAINGAWIGGVFEVALFCNFIVGIDSDGDEQSSLVQLPEIKIGAMPGFMGSIHVAQRMARLTDAVSFVAGAESLGAKEAFNKGLIDHLTHSYTEMLTAAENFCLMSPTMRKMAVASVRQNTKWRRARQTLGELKGLFAPPRRQMMFEKAQPSFGDQVGKVLMETVAPSVMEHFGATLVWLGLLYEVLAILIGGPNVHGWFVTMLVGPNFFVTLVLALAIAFGASFDASMRQWLARMVIMKIKDKTILTGPVSAAGLIMQVRDLPEDVLSGMESLLFAQEARSPFARGLVKLFVQKGGARDAFANVDAPVTENLGVIGAGVMGAGIMTVALASSLKKVVLIDIQPELLESARERALKYLHKLRWSEAAIDQAMKRLITTTDYSALQDCSVIIEAATESIDRKRSIYAQIIAVMQARPVQQPWFLLSNTSALDLDLLAEGLGEQAARFAGIHFFNRVEVMTVVEVGRGNATTDETMAVAVRLVTLLKKAPLPVFNKRGFKINAELGPYLVMFAHLIAEGIPPEDIDKAIKHTGAPMGPAALVDMVGLDTIASVAKTLRDEFGERMALPDDEKNVVAILLQLGDLGEKTGRGIYVWENGKPARDNKGKLVINPALLEAFPGLGKNKSFSREAIQTLSHGVILNEAVRSIERRVVAPEHRRYGDTAFVQGTGLTAVWGGPIGCLNAMGVRVFASLSRIIANAGPETWRKNFQPCDLLLEHERSGLDISLGEEVQEEKAVKQTA